jgi:4-cresol dehydrogenase (hydroxylating)
MTGAIAAWQAAIGVSNVSTADAGVSAAATATFATTSRVLALLRPATSAEAAECVRIANTYRVPLYPVSGGRNWGLGSRVPPSDAALLDLTGLDRILDFDDDLGVMTLEAGVTFQQAHDFLRRQSARCYLPPIGGPPEASVIGNCVERGDGFGPTGERLLHLSGLEVILPTGRIVHTGFRGLREPRLGPLSRGAAGPYLDGLFTQSNLGVVTSASVWLSRIPRHVRVVTCRIGRGSAMPTFVPRLRDLLMTGVLAPCSFSLLSAWKLLSTRGVRSDVLSAWLVNPASKWFGSGAIHASSVDHANALSALVTEALAPVTETFQLSDVDPSDLRDRWLLGAPSTTRAAAVYWAKERLPPALAPEADRCGVMWVCPAVALAADHTAQVIGCVESILPEHGFDPIASFLAMSPRSLHGFIALMYDRESPGADGRAQACHDRLLRALTDLGAYPHRLGVHSMHAWREPDDPVATLVRGLKAQLDPQRVLAPGRYESPLTPPDRPSSPGRNAEPGR